MQDNALFFFTNIQLYPLSTLSLHDIEPDDKERSCVPSKGGVLHPVKRMSEGTSKKVGSQALKVFMLRISLKGCLTAPLFGCL